MTQVSVKDFGAIGDGAADDTAAINSAVNAAGAGGRIYFPAVAHGYAITRQINLLAKQTLYGDGPASRILLQDGSINGFIAINQTGIQVRNLKFSCGRRIKPTAYKGAIILQGCSSCSVENVVVTDMGYWGVALIDCTQCTVRKCRFDEFFSADQDAADIVLWKTCVDCVVADNDCRAAANDVGIFMQDPYVNSKPTGNVISGNRVTAHKAYGICAYVTTAYDTKFIIANNRVSGIEGTSLKGASGAGIYVVGGGGASIDSNSVDDCCRSTSNYGPLAMAHIVVNGAMVGGKGVSVTNNTVNATKGPGISCSSSDLGMMVFGNTVNCAVTAGVGIQINNAQQSKVINNVIDTKSRNAAIIVIASKTVLDGIELTGNSMNAAGRGIQFHRVNTGTYANIKLKDNRSTGGKDSACYLDKASNVSVVGNRFSSQHQAFFASDVDTLHMSGNEFKSALAFPGYGIGFINGVTGYCDETNELNGVVLNNSNGVFSITQRGAAPPAYGSGYWSIGDRVLQSKPVVGQPKGWRCIAAGAPGTWVSEGDG
jgi:Pectate lyase superfamily protein